MQDTCFTRPNRYNTAGKFKKHAAKEVDVGVGRKQAIVIHTLDLNSIKERQSYKMHRQGNLLDSYSLYTVYTNNIRFTGAGLTFYNPPITATSWSTAIVLAIRSTGLETCLSN